MHEELERTLGFRVIEYHGGWQIQILNEEGKVTKVKPCLIREIWDLWCMVEAQSDVIRAPHD